MNARLSRRVNLRHRTVEESDSERQVQTARAILDRYTSWPGVVLADEVGMGKTYVALAVAVSVIDATNGESPVVVMVPPSVRKKWPLEWRKFAENLAGVDGSPIRATDAAVTKASDFLRLLDDPPETRKHVIFMTHGALTNPLRDPLVQLAIVRQAFRRAPKRLRRQRSAFERWATHLIPSLREVHVKSDHTVAALLRTDPAQWRRVLLRETGHDFGDDPVPQPIRQVLPALDMEPSIAALMELPLSSSKSIDRRLRDARRPMNEAVREVWADALSGMDISLPLLILDEAHHAKNPWTGLSRLFANEEEADDAKEFERGALGGVFDRMLFLTATPFQLGHHELLQVLHRFEAITWEGLDRAAYQAHLAALDHALDDARVAALRLDGAWARLQGEEMVEGEGWWTRPDDPALPERMRSTARHWLETRNRVLRAQELLGPLVIRHMRPDRETRRATLTGAGIATDDPTTTTGLDVEGEAVLPFLLVARAQGALARAAVVERERARALFADGLASSFEAYRKTRGVTDPAEIADDEAALEHGSGSSSLASLGWYLDHIEHALPDDDMEVFGSHPKVAATTSRVLELWREREKVLVFCFYRATGAALRRHIARAIQGEIDRLALQRLGLTADQAPEARATIDRFNARLDDPRSPASRTARSQLDALLSAHLASGDLETAREVALRFLRTPSFLVRYADLRLEAADAITRGFTLPDASGRTLKTVIDEFGAFLADRDEQERREYLDAMKDLQVGSRTVDDEHGVGEALVPNVRLANGGVSADTRHRLMLGFNTPFFPEVLVASSVMAEGVDLHLACRHVIHHDLDWNPSVIEQRTGRLDRIGSKQEKCGHPIRVFEPFVQGAQDEKQFRVMKDRERWFNVVMGEKLELDEWSTDRIAERVPLPEAAARGVTMDLSVWSSGALRTDGDPCAGKPATIVEALPGGGDVLIGK